MTIHEFIKKYENKSVDTDGAYGGQCMDLMHAYCRDVLEIQDLRVLAAPAAKDVYINFNNIYGHELFSKVANTPTGVPEEGDIMFWNTKIGPYGHVAIYMEGDANKFVSFDQNWNNVQICKKISHDYTGVIGWLRMKDKEAAIDYKKLLEDEKEARGEENRKNEKRIEELHEEVVKLRDELTEKTELCGKLAREIEASNTAGYGSRIIELENTLAEKEQEIKSLKKIKEKAIADYSITDLVLEIKDRILRR